MANRSESEFLTSLPLKMTPDICRCLYLFAILHGNRSESEFLTGLPLKMAPYICRCLYLYASLHVAYPRRLESRSAVVFFRILAPRSPPPPPPTKKSVIRTNNVLSVCFVIVKMSEGE